MTGTLLGVGVGPGDPELITLKAHRIISQAKIIAYPSTETGESFAREIAAKLLPDDVTEIPIKIPMVAARYPSQAVYNKAHEVIDRHLLADRDVVVICQGDPFFFGSFMYLFAKFVGKVPIEIVPGITSLTACSAASLRPLCARLDTVTVIPGGLDDHQLEAALLGTGAFAIMKVGRHLSRLRSVLNKLFLADRSIYISHATLPNQVVLPLAEAPDTAPYFSMILIPSEDEHVAY